MQEIDGQMVILDRDNNQIHTLNSTASDIWAKLDGKTTIEEVTESLAQKYDVDKSILVTDVNKLVGEFKKLNLVQT